MLGLKLNHVSKRGSRKQTTRSEFRLCDFGHTLISDTTPQRLRDDVIQWKHCPSYWPFVKGFPSKRPVTQSFDVFFDVRLKKWLRQQSRRRWFETHSAHHGLRLGCGYVITIVVFVWCNTPRYLHTNGSLTKLKLENEWLIFSYFYADVITYPDTNPNAIIAYFC